ncbi:hypothetical protein PC129_g7201 [Phytophthora cactorum]|uniref:Uncharacterized protein n=1 Tax=Phytophthora cactorum TaxID=29920 RepID=A0A8T1DNM5_9STRA|nr:hypothetical protein Pcac1_g23054 [Phytophthora cactorum]KAG2909633.1 hypothetical protein PC114_g10045 [Phytophthora cactorum]KAG2942276.1 hypothetical protein PC117_g9844 [Phytophthora cactorum]KAG3021668.1 hypothetical protein PC119_g9548 [Phytophthora cactorum]KAG3025648.1 hypothetical protein PC120_g6350 [Phytophthora cactorum]
MAMLKSAVRKRVLNAAPHFLIHIVVIDDEIYEELV